ncbi:MAG: glutathione S-transferase N-terminal domain-containing protein [Burkholderiales bacterium]
MAIELFYSPSPNVYKVMIALEELALPYDITFVDLSQGQQFEPAKLGGSVAAKVPVLRDTEPAWGGEPVSVMESGAILQYLAEKTGALMPADPAGRILTMQWLFWQMGHLGPIGGQHWHFKAFAPRIEPDTNFDYPRRRYTRMLDALWAVMERRLAQVPFLAGDYSIADVACYPWAQYLWPEDVSTYPCLSQWKATIAERPAVQQAYARNAAVKTEYGRTERQTIAYPWEGLRQHTIVA